MNKEKLIQKVALLLDAIDAGKPLSEADNYLLIRIENLVCDKVIADIKTRQDKIPNLIIEGHGHKVRWGGDLTPGCHKCLETELGFYAIRGATKCNLDCNFCYYKGLEVPSLLNEHFVLHDRYYNLDEMKIMIDKQMVEKDTGVAWVYREPFTELDKLLPLIEYISLTQDRHQWLYTNGTLCTEDNLRKLQDAGLQEIRFNLAATNCSDDVIKNMHIARRLFKYVCIESPMYKEYYDTFMSKRKEILDTGVNQINCAELQLHDGNKVLYQSEDLYMYRQGYCSPISSHHFTYDMMEIAAIENWSVVINDCSNMLKKYRSFVRGSKFGVTSWDYATKIYLGWYLQVMEKYNMYELVDSF